MSHTVPTGWYNYFLSFAMTYLTEAHYTTVENSPLQLRIWKLRHDLTIER